MRRLILIAVALVPVAFPVAAQAQERPLERAVSVAEAYWGPTRCQGPIEVLESTQLPGPPTSGSETEAWTTFETPAGPLYWPSSTYSSCVVNLSESMYPTEAVMTSNYLWLCQVMVHEYGHLVGWADSTTAYAPSDIRYPLMSEANVPYACQESALAAYPTTYKTLRDTVKVYPFERKRRRYRGFER